MQGKPRISKSGYFGLSSGGEVSVTTSGVVSRQRQTFVELFKALKLWREAAFAGRIDDEDDFALEIGQRVVVALLVLGLEVVECGGGGHACV